MHETRKRERDKRGEREDIWSSCSHSASQVSTPSDAHTHTHIPDTIGDINILWGI